MKGYGCFSCDHSRFHLLFPVLSPQAFHVRVGSLGLRWVEATCLARVETSIRADPPPLEVPHGLCPASNLSVETLQRVVGPKVLPCTEGKRK